MFSCAKIIDYMTIAILKSSSSISISYKYLNIFKLLYLIRGIYVRFLRQQERHSFSVSIVGSYMRWGKTALHTKLT
jgi:hypothetical protein